MNVESEMRSGFQSQIFFGIPQKYLHEWTEILDEWDGFVNQYSEWKLKNDLDLKEDNLITASFTFIEQFTEITSSNSSESVKNEVR